MTKWKTGCFKQMNVIIGQIQKETEGIKVEHKKQVEVAKAVNALRAGLLLEHRGLKDYFKGWIGVTKNLKLLRFK